MTAIRESIARGYNGSTITIFTDNKAALKALESVTVESKLVLEWTGTLQYTGDPQLSSTGVGAGG